MSSKKRITVLFAGRVYPDVIGGAEIFAFRLCKTLRMRGHSVAIAGILSGESESVYRKLGIITCGSLPSAYRHLPRNVARVLNLLSLTIAVALFEKRERSAVLLCFGTHAALIAYPLSHVLGTKFVVRCMGGDIQSLERRAHSLGDRVEKAAYSLAFAFTKRASLIIVMSDWMRMSLATLGTTTNIIKIPNAVDWRPTRTKRRIVTKSPTLVYVGRFVREMDAEKGIDILLDAFMQLRKVRPSVRLTLIGRGPMKKAITDRAASEGISDYCRVTQASGPDQVKAILRTCDIFVFPSRGEGMSNALLEAAVTGLPVVATDIPANREFLRDVPGSILVEPSPASLCRGILAMMNDLRRRTRLARRAAIELATAYSMNSIASRYEKVLAKR